MFEKNGKWYADWRDRRGKRLRKSFTSKRAAMLFEAEQRSLAHPKPNARGLRLRPSSSRASVGAVAVTQPPALRTASSPAREASRPASSTKRTSSKSTRLYVVRTTHTQRASASPRPSAHTCGTSGSTTARRSSTKSSRVSPASVRATSQPQTKNGKRS